MATLAVPTNGNTLPETPTLTFSQHTEGELNIAESAESTERLQLQLDDEELARLERLVRKLKLRKRDEVVQSSSRDEYQRQWDNEISEYLVNHSGSKMRILFKRLEKIPYTDLNSYRFGGPSASEPLTKDLTRERSPTQRRFRMEADENWAPRKLNESSSALSDMGEHDDREARKVQLEDLFKKYQIWTSWQYRYAYPRLTAFLEAADIGVNARCEVSVKDFRYHDQFETLDAWDTTEIRVIERHKATRLTSNQKILDHRELWTRVRSRFKADGMTWTVPCRTFKIVDLSPTCATLLVGSSPRVDLSYVATFLERYLGNSNWATANLITATRADSMLRNYLLEYHFSFYHVTSSFMTNLDWGYGDDRKVREVSPFTAGSKTRARRIYEEQLSFLVIGHGGDVYTNIQLAEKYSCDPEDDTYDMPFYLKSKHDSSNPRDPFKGSRDERDDRPKGLAFFVDQRKPCSAFLAWIANSLRHIITRWQSAINAVDVEIQTTFQATFHGDKHSLLSDDSSFSKSKKYIWAIQVYRVFEKKLEETIAVWEKFETNSLDKLDDRQLKEHKQQSLEIIHAAIETLKRKLVHVKTRRNEVTDMKDGLFATSQLLDSRVSVRQNDNIKLLTYVNLLFLPLAFCTSIFGMQTILPNQIHASWFAVTLCAVTVFTVFLVFNLQIMSEVVERMISKGTEGLRKLMSFHHRPHWHKTGQALQTSRDATTIIVQNRLRRTSHWMYFIFLLEWMFITVPVRELKFTGVIIARLRIWRKRRNADDSARRSRRKSIHVAGNLLQMNQPQFEEERRMRSFSRKASGVILALLRALPLPLWLTVIGVELMVMLPYLWLCRAFEPRSSREKEEVAPRLSAWMQCLVKFGFYEEDKRQLPVAFQRKLRRWHAEYVDRNEEHARHQRMQSLKHGDSYYKKRSEIEIETRNRRMTVHAPEFGMLAVPRPPRSRRNSESNLAPQSIVPESGPTRPKMARTRSWLPARQGAK